MLIYIVGRQLPGRDRLHLIEKPGQDPDPDPGPDPGPKTQVKVNLQRVHMGHPGKFQLMIHLRKEKGMLLTLIS